MTDIEWGAKIAVDGKRPEWLRDDDKVNPVWDSKSEYGQAINNNKYIACIERLSRIRLPATHDYYKATSRGFTYWPGGESAPDDWDGGDCLDCDGNILSARNVWDSDWPSQTVIGYRKRTEQPAPAIAPELVERAFNVVRRVANGGDNGTWWKDEARAILSELEPDPDLTLAKSIVGDAEAIALAIKAARENGRG